MAESCARVRSLSLTDFRNFERLELAFPEKGFVLIGENGQGKTNLLESVYYLSLLRSGRGASDQDVVRFGAAGFHVAAEVTTPGAERIAVGFERAGRRKRVRKDGAPLTRLSDGLGLLPAVMFSPSDVELVSGPPSARRRFLDVMFAVTSRGYLHALQQYRGALDRRNAVLRDLSRSTGRVVGRGDAGAADVWEGPLAEHGATLVRTRRAWVRRVTDRFAELCRAIGEQAPVTLRHETGVSASAESVEQELAAALAARRESDARYGLTQFGPHRDDLALQIGGRSLRDFGSAGQHRTAAIALRLLEAETVRESRGASPVFLLDDPLAELDANRSARVLELLAEVGLGQTVLAVPRDADIPEGLTSLARFHVCGGRVTAA